MNGKNMVNAFIALCLTVFLFTGCMQPAMTILPGETIEEGGLTDDEFSSLIGGRKTLTEVPGTGNLVSLGPSVTGATYYIDGGNGNDNFNGRSPLTPWRTFVNANGREFQPGDHILLEANSIWNGESTTADNWATLRDSPTVGMLWPRGNGSYMNHIVIDLYHIEDFDTDNPKVSYRAARRPIINGNGTPPPGSNRWFSSGAITLINQHHWWIRNIEVTNTFADPIAEPNHWYAQHVPKHLMGIAILGWGDNRNNPDFRQVVIPEVHETYNVIVEHCYVHDVQSMHNNNSGSGGNFGASSTGGLALGGGTPSPIFKITGGIIVYGMPYNMDGASISPGNNGYNGVLLQHNIVRRVALAGIRNKSVPDGSGAVNSNVVFRGNFIEYVAGDGIVLDAIQYSSGLNARGNHMNGLVEHNIIKDSCAAPNTGTSNYAGVWAMTCRDTTFQFNEAYGIVYGYQDGEAWDIDIGSDRVIYQYNYSHHNAGGSILFMSNITDPVYRYNISANDGGGARFMATVTEGVSTTANSYTQWQNGQKVFHHSRGSGGSSVPLIYNNTIYSGPGHTVSLFGSNSSGVVNNYVRFFNNVVLKAGAGTVYITRGNAGVGGPSQSGILNNPEGFADNILWGYETNPAEGVQTKFHHGGTTNTISSVIIGQNNNRFVNPNLRIQQTGVAAQLRQQRDDTLPASAYTNPAELMEFTGRERLRSRASLFAPVDDSSPVLTGGRAIPNGGNTAATDGAWNPAQPIITQDFFGNTFNNTQGQRHVGAATAPYTP
ncbi:MAG: hypothetical protein FWG89_11160 [Treponema sp.]|nr:hypothetical protein [Treponema sp.]